MSFSRVEQLRVVEPDLQHKSGSQVRVLYSTRVLQISPMSLRGLKKAVLQKSKTEMQNLIQIPSEKTKALLFFSVLCVEKLDTFLFEQQD